MCMNLSTRSIPHNGDEARVTRAHPELLELSARLARAHAEQRRFDTAMQRAQRFRDAVRERSYRFRRDLAAQEVEDIQNRIARVKGATP